MQHIEKTGFPFSREWQSMFILISIFRIYLSFSPKTRINQKIIHKWSIILQNKIKKYEHAQWVFILLESVYTPRGGLYPVFKGVLKRVPWKGAYLEELATRNLKKISPAWRPFEMTAKKDKFKQFRYDLTPRSLKEWALLFHNLHYLSLPVWIVIRSSADFSHER